MNETKPWYLSRTVWSGLTTSVLAMLMAMGVVPSTVSETLADEAALVLLGIGTIYSRIKADKKIALPTTEVTTSE